MTARVLVEWRHSKLYTSTPLAWLVAASNLIACLLKPSGLYTDRAALRHLSTTNYDTRDFPTVINSALQYTRRLTQTTARTTSTNIDLRDFDDPVKTNDVITALNNAKQKQTPAIIIITSETKGCLFYVRPISNNNFVVYVIDSQTTFNATHRAIVLFISQCLSSDTPPKTISETDDDTYKHIQQRDVLYIPDIDS